MKCIIFDKDGTLIEFSDFWYPLTLAVVSNICNNCNADEKIKNKILYGIGFEDGIINIDSIMCYGTYSEIGKTIYNILKNNGISAEENQIIADTQYYFEKYTFLGKIKPTSPDLKDLLKDLKNKGIKLFVVTTDCTDIAKISLDKLGITEYFEEILADDGIYPPKPDPYYINYISGKYGFDKKDMCMIGDAVSDMKFAQNGGINGYGVGVTAANRKTLDKYAVHTGKNISELFKNYEI